MQLPKSLGANFFTGVIAAVIICLGRPGLEKETTIQSKDVAPIWRADLPRY